MAYNYYPYNPYPASNGQQAGFIRVPSEDYARNYQLAPGTSGTFIDETKPYCYVKTMDVSPLGTFKFERYRLVKEEDSPAPKEADTPTPEYALKSDLTAVWKELEEIKKSFTSSKKKVKDDE